MRDLFDEFMEELRRRQAAQEGRGESDEGASPQEEPVDESRERESEGKPEPQPAEEPEEPQEPEEPRESQEPIRPFGRGGGRGGRRPPRRRRGGPNDGFGYRVGQVGRRFGVALVVLAVFLLIALAGFGLDLWTDAIWFGSVGYVSVFWTRLGTQAALLIGFGALANAVLLGNLWLAGRLSPPTEAGTTGSFRGFFDRLSEAARAAGDGSFGTGGGPGDRHDGGIGRGRPPIGPRGVVFEQGEIPDLTPLGVGVLVALAIVLALGTGFSVAGHWETILLWQHRVPFSPDPATTVTDPIFGRDISFFLFELPFLRLAQSIANGLIFSALLVSLARYALSMFRGSFLFTTPIRVHLAILGGLYLISVAGGYQLDKFELVYSGQGVATGVSFTDQAARFVAFDVLTVIAAFVGAFLIGGAFTRLVWPLGLAVVVWFVASIALGQLYPQAIQRFSVEPNEFAQEEPYIGNNIRMTRLAFGLDQWGESRYQGDAPLSQDKIDAEEATFRNARLWDYRPLQSTLGQVQTIRQYYTFVDVDTDRYEIDGETRQVMLSARELAERNPQASSWVNQRITFTHGIGLAMVPVNEVTPEGQPRLFVRDLPPVSDANVPKVSEPRIYFGEEPSSYVLVDARQSEFDYPSAVGGSSAGEQGAETRWRGTTGIRLDTTLARLLFAARFRDLNLLISDQVTPDTQLLFHRSLKDRLGRIAPFLRYDKDPYVVVTADGRLVYIQDAYTTSDRFPNADPFFPAQRLGQATGLGDDPFNYIRNSVKVVVDAYDGTTTFYAADPGDPILRTYEGVFPGLFRPLAQLPADLQTHLRVPEELFNVQIRMYETYHVTEPGTFYNKGDLWTVPEESGAAESLPMEAYYVVMRMPGEPKAEFLLLQPMLPAKRPNMIAWVAARNDSPNYAGVRVYRFPEDTTVFGPAQIEARINQDPIISAQITLWDQAGSTVVRGNLIVVPVQEALVYIQPIYLQSTSGKFPEFKKIVVASPTRVVWGDSLADSLRSLLAAGPGQAPGPAPTPSPGPSPSPGASPTPGPTLPAGDVQGLVEYANGHFELAQAALRAGDFATYGEEIKLVQEALRQLSQLVGTSATPSQSPSGSVTPAP